MDLQNPHTMTGGLTKSHILIYRGTLQRTSSAISSGRPLGRNGDDPGNKSFFHTGGGRRRKRHPSETATRKPPQVTCILLGVPPKRPRTVTPKVTGRKPLRYKPKHGVVVRKSKKALKRLAREKRTAKKRR
jgi:hypothetical protein